MASITIRIPPDLLKRLDDFAEVRGFADRSQAARAAIREAVMEPEERQTVPARDELLRLLGDSARDGSVTAMKALLEEHRRDGNDEPTQREGSAIDEVARKRVQRAQ